MNIYRVLFILLITLIIGCNKEPINDINTNSIKLHRIIIINKSDTLLQLAFNDSLIISCKSMENNTIEETEYHYNSNGLLTGLTINNLQYNNTTYKDFLYDSEKRISSINICQVLQNGDSLKEKQILDYNATGKLIKINSFLPETFEYFDNNVSKNSMVNEEVAIWTDYVFSYDNMTNPIYNIGLPLISAKQLSHNNIKSKIALWVEHLDCMIPNDPNCNTINHVDTIYSSKFEYNTDNKPKIEYRKYKSEIDTLRYFYE